MRNKNTKAYILTSKEMKRITAPLLIIFTLLLNLLAACDGLDENYSTNPNHRLSFSTDTLSFDTVFTTIGSATKQFMVYNRNDEPLNIERIIQASPATSGFRINVDGRKGDNFDNVRIAANDSMYVFVEVTVNPNGKDQPLLIQDSIQFSYNSVKQTVLLEACGQDVKLIKGGQTLSEDTRLTAERPYLIYDSLTIGNGVTVEIEEGTTFYMHDKAKIIVEGTIVANGSQEKPVTFRGDRLDFILNDLLPYDRTPGQWEGIVFKKESFNNLFNNVIVRNGNNGIFCEASEPENPKLKITNSQITNMDGSLFTAINCNVEAANSEFTNATADVMVLAGGKYNFIHCTIANYMSLKSRHSLSQDGQSSQTLRLWDNVTVDKAGPFPLLEATFDNCIIDGSHRAANNLEDGELQITTGKEYALSSTGQNYRFNHCVIKLQPTDDAGFNDVIFVTENDKDKMEYRMTGGERNKYTYDFRPDKETTPGVGKADLFVTQKYPVDRYGVNRLTNNGPDIGAYEYVAQEEDN